MSATADALRALIGQGLTFAETVKVFAERNTPDDERIIEKARRLHEREGEVEVEFDDAVLTAGSADAGDYVMAWVWVYDDEADQ